MRYQISGKQLDIGDALQTHVKTELGETLDKYSQRPTDAFVVFSRGTPGYRCEISVHLSTGLTAAAKGAGTEVYAAFEDCREHLDKQLRRYKRRLKDHQRNRLEPVEFGDAGMYVLAADTGIGESEPESLAPVIVAEMEAKVPTLSVGEAVMQMEIAGKPMLVFRNEKHGGVNVVHRREDGNVGWIDPRHIK